MFKWLKRVFNPGRPNLQQLANQMWSSEVPLRIEMRIAEVCRFYDHCRDEFHDTIEIPMTWEEFIGRKEQMRRYQSLQPSQEEDIQNEETSEKLQSLLSLLGDIRSEQIPRCMTFTCLKCQYRVPEEMFKFVLFNPSTDGLKQIDQIDKSIRQRGGDLVDPKDQESLAQCALYKKRCPTCGHDSVEVIVDPKPVLRAVAKIKNDGDPAP